MAASMAWPSAASIHRSEPSLQPLGQDEHANAYQDHETDRGVRSCKIVALGKLIDKLAEAAEIDQKFDADDIDERENQTESQPYEDGRQCGGKQNLPELLRRRQIETPAHVDQHAPCGGKALECLEDDGSEAGGEAHHGGSQRAPAEDHVPRNEDGWKGGEDVGRQRQYEAVDEAAADEQFEESDQGKERADAERG